MKHQQDNCEYWEFFHFQTSSLSGPVCYKYTFFFTYVMVIVYPIIKTKQEMLNIFLYFNKNIAKLDEVRRWFILNPLRNKIVFITE